MSLAVKKTTNYIKVILFYRHLFWVNIRFFWEFNRRPRLLTIIKIDPQLGFMNDF